MRTNELSKYSNDLPASCHKEIVGPFVYVGLTLILSRRAAGLKSAAGLELGAKPAL